MIIIGIILILVGLFGLAAGVVAFGDIGLACTIGGITAFFSGIAIVIASNKIKKLQTIVDTQSKSIKQLIEMTSRRR